MGKVRDEAPAAKAANKPAPKGASKANKGRVAPFFANFFQTKLYKASQGRYARLWTGIGLGVILVAGVWKLYDNLKGLSNPWARFGIPALVLGALAWVLIRIMHYPPFADFLIATEAEMNKVSWTSRADLHRATVVVLLTVLIMTFFLFGVDFIWSWLLERLHILRFAMPGSETTG